MCNRVWITIRIIDRKAIGVGWRLMQQDATDMGGGHGSARHGDDSTAHLGREHVDTRRGVVHRVTPVREAGEDVVDI